MASPSQYRIWWINPAWAFALAILPFAVSAMLISDPEYLFYWRTPRYFDDQEFTYICSCVAAFIIGCGVAFKLPTGNTRVEWGKFSERELKFLLLLFRGGAFMTIAAYVVWMLSAVKKGLSLGLVISGLTGQGTATYELRDYMTTIPGVTTAVQFGIAVFIIGVVLIFNGMGKKVTKWMLLILLMAMVRSFLNSERIAVTELFIPAACLVLFYRRNKLALFLRGVPSFIWPPVAVVGLYLLFTGTEYLRSWSAAYAQEGTYDSVWEFTFTRLVGYYVTALNNGAVTYQIVGGMSDVPLNTFAWFWKFPVVGHQAYSMLSPNPTIKYGDVLSEKANPEFNNCSGLYGAALDWGEVGAVFFFFLIGILIFNLYRRFASGNVLGLFLYPFAYTGILEICRIFYWPEGRCLPSWILLLVAIVGVSRLVKKRTPDSGHSEMAPVPPRNQSQPNSRSTSDARRRATSNRDQADW